MDEILPESNGMTGGSQYSLIGIEHETGDLKRLSDLQQCLATHSLTTLKELGVKVFAEKPCDRHGTYSASINKTLVSSGIPSASIKGIVFVPPDPHWSLKAEKELMKSLADVGFDRLPVVGISLQGCSAFVSAISQAIILNQTVNGPILIVMSALPEFGSNYDSDSGVLYSFGVASAILVAGGGTFTVLSTVTKTDTWLGAHDKADDPERHFRKSYELIKLSVSELLTNSGLQSSDIAILCGTNVNTYALSMVSMIAKIPTDRIWYGGLSEVGHLYSGDAFVSLHQLKKSGLKKTGERILVVGWSPVTFSAALIRMD